MLSANEIIGLKKIKKRKIILWLLLVVWVTLIYTSALSDDYGNIIFLISIAFFFVLLFYAAFVALSTCPRCNDNFGSVTEMFSTKCRKCGLKLSDIRNI